MMMEDPEDKTNGSVTEKTAVEQNEDGELIEKAGPDTVLERHPAVVSSGRPSTPVVVLIDDLEGDNLTEETAVENNEDENETIEEPASDAVPERHLAADSPNRPSTLLVVLIDDSEGDNPQEASSPLSHKSPAKAEPVQQDIVAREESFSKQGSVALKSRKRRRRVALVKGDAQDRLMLPSNQYETVLRRRAIRKRDDDARADSSPTSSGKRVSLFGTKTESDEQKGVPNEDVVEEYDEEYGDISVGMKLNM
jgi:hypothetical protein